MVANLPPGQCTIVVPRRVAGQEIAARVKKGNPGPRRYVTIRSAADIQKIIGLSEPVFFDHSFFDVTEEHLARAAVTAAISCARMASWSAK
jgi:hypothetical protein